MPIRTYFQHRYTIEQRQCVHCKSNAQPSSNNTMKHKTRRITAAAHDELGEGVQQSFEEIGVIIEVVIDRDSVRLGDVVDDRSDDGNEGGCGVGGVGGVRRVSAGQSVDVRCRHRKTQAQLEEFVDEEERRDAQTRLEEGGQSRPRGHSSFGFRPSRPADRRPPRGSPSRLRSYCQLAGQGCQRDTPPMIVKFFGSKRSFVTR